VATQPFSPAPSEEHASAAPFPHIVIDRAFANDRVHRIAAEARALEPDAQRPFYGQARKRGTTDRGRMGVETLALIDDLNGPRFIAWLEELTGIEGLIADPQLFGAGVHRIDRGGFLKIHTDFNWHAGLGLHRRLNLLLYLNQGWREEWGGHLELWHPDMSRCGARVAPLLNRMVIFSTTDTSYHGHPEPLACPEGVTRNSLALYYYSRDPAPGVRFRGSLLTDYRPRPGERFGGPRRWLHKLKMARHRHAATNEMSK